MSKPFLNSLTDISAVADYLNRINAEARSLDLAIVEEKINENYWRDKVYIRFKDEAKNIEIYPEEYYNKYKPTEAEHTDIKAQWNSFQHPEYKLLGTNLLEELLLDRHKTSRDEDMLFVFYNKNKSKVLMLQEKVYDKKGRKRYIPWTFWSDRKWRVSETPEKLPIYGLEQIGELGSENTLTIFIHEGAKGARFCKRLLEDDKLSHPWKDEMFAIHVGWIGGALNPYRTDWEELRKAKPACIYIVPDNDDEGYECVTKISAQMRCLTYGLQYPDGFGKGFDLADPIPDKYYEEEMYIGPAFYECVRHATYLTDIEEIIDNSFKIPKIKRIIKLRPHVRGLWAYIKKTEQWAFTRDLTEVYKHLGFYRVIAGYHHGKGQNVVDLLLKKQKRTLSRFAYIPSKVTKAGQSVISDGNKLVLNMYSPCKIKPIKGDFQPFLEFMEHLIPNEEERHETLKWCATLIAHPELRMKYSVLMISDTKGVGKSTLGEYILRHLVGTHNASMATDKTVLSGFNSWAKHKTLVIIEEIYTGKKWTMYNALKTYITEPTISINEKGIKTYDCENMCHFYACSNSHKALKIEDGDRRWLIPEVNEVLWGGKKFIDLHTWLKRGGRHYIRYWAEMFDDYVQEGDHAPITHLKRSIVEESLSISEVYARRIGEIIVRGFPNEPAVISIEDMKEIIKMHEPRINQSNLLLLKSCMKGAKMAQTTSNLNYVIRENRSKATSRVYHKGKLNYCLGNPIARNMFKEEMENNAFRDQMLAVMNKTMLEVMNEMVNI